jgi:hypothetical protein
MWTGQALIQQLPVLQSNHHFLHFRLIQDLSQDFGVEGLPLFFSDLPNPVPGPHRVVLILLGHGSILGKLNALLSLRSLEHNTFPLLSPSQEELLTELLESGLLL